MTGPAVTVGALAALAARADPDVADTVDVIAAHSTTLMASFDTAELLEHALKLAIAYALSLPVAWNRERAIRSAGLRTFPLVAIASCGFALLGRSAMATSVDAQARIIQGLITGIGFVGGGAILRSKHRVTGTATASSIWMTGAVGASVAYARLEIAVLLSLLNFATLKVLSRFKTEAENAAEGDDSGDD